MRKYAKQLKQHFVTNAAATAAAQRKAQLVTAVITAATTQAKQHKNDMHTHYDAMLNSALQQLDNVTTADKMFAHGVLGDVLLDY
jgi:hypothetical protein